MMLNLVLAAGVSAFLTAPVSPEKIALCKQKAETLAWLQGHYQIGTTLPQLFEEIARIYPKERHHGLQQIALLIYEHDLRYETQQEKRKAVDKTRDLAFRACIKMDEKILNP